MKNGIIILDSDRAKELGFTSDKFGGWLWKKDDEIMISFIESHNQGKGNLKTLFDKIIEMGFSICVPTPFARMEMICNKYGMKKIIRQDDMFGPVECMIMQKK